MIQEIVLHVDGLLFCLCLENACTCIGTQIFICFYSRSLAIEWKPYGMGIVSWSNLSSSSCSDLHDYHVGGLLTGANGPKQTTSSFFTLPPSPYLPMSFQSSPESPQISSFLGS